MGLVVSSTICMDSFCDQLRNSCRKRKSAMGILVALVFSSVISSFIRLLFYAMFGRQYMQTLLKVFEFARRELANEQDANTSQALEKSATEKCDEAWPRHKEERRLIERDASKRIVEKFNATEREQQSEAFSLTDDSFDFVKAGIEAIIEDDVTKRFSAQDVSTCNMLTRTLNAKLPLHRGHFTWRLALLWFVSFIFRYCFLLPERLVALSIGLSFLIFSAVLIGCLPNSSLRESAYWYTTLIGHRICAFALSVDITYHNRQFRARRGSICVANHTSPIDGMILLCDNTYVLIGQLRHGLSGFVQRALSRAANHIWFERSATNDRAAVIESMRNHVANKNNLPILIFPEGTCINNTALMMFRKGSFEIDCPFYPIAIRFDPRFGEAFWVPSDSIVLHILKIMTSWAVVVDVWYLPPMLRQSEEDSIMFAGRVKRAIAEAGGFLELEWDGQLKRMPVSEKLRAKRQKLFALRLMASATEASATTVDNNNKSSSEKAFEQIDAFDDNVVTSHVEQSCVRRQSAASIDEQRS